MASPAALSVVDSAFCNMAGQELTSHASALGKDASKRKRVNRKLKQCKMDARREQWLSQVTTMKHCKATQNDSSPATKLDLGELVDPENCERLAFGSRDSQNFTSEKVEKSLLHAQLHLQAVENCKVTDLKDDSSPSGSGSCISDCLYSEISPKSIGSASPERKVKKTGTFRGQDIRGKCSNEGKSKEEATAGPFGRVLDFHLASDELDECLHDSGSEDWETAADALGLYASQVDVTDRHVREKPEKEVILKLSKATLSSPASHISATPCEVISRSFSTKAWSPDDAFRPSSLPNLSKQQSLPAYFPDQNNRWVGAKKALQDLLSGPSTCPICAEELDTTDSSFEPCECGFQLCLFCHHRIASEDGRCPGCRRFYSSSTVATFAHSPILS